MGVKGIVKALGLPVRLVLAFPAAVIGGVAVTTVIPVVSAVLVQFAPTSAAFDPPFTRPICCQQAVEIEI